MLPVSTDWIRSPSAARRGALRVRPEGLGRVPAFRGPFGVSACLMLCERSEKARGGIYTVDLEGFPEDHWFGAPGNFSHLLQ